ncbi:helix-turn-helix transcriptional regulator [Streptomyces sp. BYX5S]
MFEAALDVWEGTVRDVPPREVPTLMVKAAINAAYERAKVHVSESSTDYVEDLLMLEEAVTGTTLKASSIIHEADPRDPAVAEQIRGERTGALWQMYGLGEAVNRYHEDLRARRRPGLRDTLATEAMLARTWVTGSNYYYYTSDFYPKFVDLPAAAEALGIAKSAAYKMVRAGSFPCLTTRMGCGIQVPTKELMHSLSVEDVIVHLDDVENGAARAGGN